jgi:hypothetical protein
MIRTLPKPPWKTAAFCDSELPQLLATDGFEEKPFP